MGSLNVSEKPHAVCIPFPAQGHINPMLKVAKLLHSNGFHISFVNTEYNHKRLLKSRGPNALNGLPSFQFWTIPDGLPPPPEDVEATQDIPALCESTTTTCLAPFRELLARINEAAASSDVPPVSCIVSDGVMSFTLQAAEELGVPEVLFWTTSACGFLAYTQFERLINEGYSPLKDTSYLTNGYLNTVVDATIPSMKGVRLRDIPSFIRTTNPDEFMTKFVLSETSRAKKASAIILNTFDALEQDVLNALSSILPPIYPIGPLDFIENQLNNKGLDLDHIGSNLWKEDPQCLEWLDSKEPNSVVYVNFGSITVMTPDQLTEFAWGLANSNQSFLWIIRPDLVSGEKALLPHEFLEVTKERGMLANWCLQEKVLNHPSVGGFLTHSGWNSTLESINRGVPMICWPFFAEQQTNCWYCCEKLGVGMEIDSDVKRDEVERLVRELMCGEKGREMKRSAMEWKKLAEECGKSSACRNLEKVITEVLLPGRVEKV